MRDFGDRQNWQFKGLPVLVWEFGPVEDFIAAQRELMQCIAPHMVPGENLAKIIGPDICEVDCFGVTFRLICKGRLAIPGKGSFSANDLLR